MFRTKNKTQSRKHGNMEECTDLPIANPRVTRTKEQVVSITLFYTTQERLRLVLESVNCSAGLQGIKIPRIHNNRYQPYLGQDSQVNLDQQIEPGTVL